MKSLFLNHLNEYNLMQSLNGEPICNVPTGTCKKYTPAYNNYTLLKECKRGMASELRTKRINRASFILLKECKDGAILSENKRYNIDIVHREYIIDDDMVYLLKDAKNECIICKLVKSVLYDGKQYNDTIRGLKMLRVIG